MQKHVPFVLDSFIGVSSISSHEISVLTMSCGYSHLEFHINKINMGCQLKL